MAGVDRSEPSETRRLPKKSPGSDVGMDDSNQFVNSVLLVAFLGVVSLFVMPADPISFLLAWALSSMVGIAVLAALSNRER